MHSVTPITLAGLGMFALASTSSVTADDDDIIFQDRLEVIEIQRPGTVAERVIPRSVLGGDSPNAIKAFGDKAAFTLTPTLNREIWFADGNEDGTVVVELPEGFRSVTVRGAVVQGGRIYFISSQANNVPAIWASDGTQANTELVMDGNELGLSGPIGELTAVADAIFFHNNTAQGRKLFRLNEQQPGGAEAITGVRVNVSTSRAMTAFDNRLFVGGRLDGTPGVISVMPDGTSTLTWQLEGGQGPFPLSEPGSLTTMGGNVYFSASGGEGVALWRIGSAGAAQRLFNPSDSAEQMRGAENLVAANGRLYFVTRRWNPDIEDFESGTRLALSEGSPNSTNWFWPPATESPLSNGANMPTAAFGQRLLFLNLVTNGTVSSTDQKFYGDQGNIRPDHTVPGEGGLWLTATSGQHIAFAGFEAGTSFAVTEPENLWINSNAVNLAMVDGLPWFIGRTFGQSFEIWRMAPEESD